MSAQPWTFHKRFSGSVLVPDTVPLAPPPPVFFLLAVSLWVYATGHSHSVSSCTGYTKLINFLRTTPPLPKWCGCSPRPGAQCGNDPQVKGRLASSSIKGKDCNCTMRRLCEEKGEPAVTKIYYIEKTSNFFFKWCNAFNIFLPWVNIILKCYILFMKNNLDLVGLHKL